MNALVVEDSPQMAERLAQLARDAGLQIAGIVHTQDDAIAAAERELVDVALVDLQLHQGTGFGFIREVRHDKSRVMAIIVVTNHAVPALKVASFEAGADYFLDKSKDLDRITSLLRELVLLRAPEPSHG